MPDIPEVLLLAFFRGPSRHFRLPSSRIFRSRQRIARARDARIPPSEKRKYFECCLPSRTIRTDQPADSREMFVNLLMNIQ